MKDVVQWILSICDSIIFADDSSILNGFAVQRREHTITARLMMQIIQRVIAILYTR